MILKQEMASGLQEMAFLFLASRRVDDVPSCRFALYARFLGSMRFYSGCSAIGS